MIGELLDNYVLLYLTYLPIRVWVLRPRLTATGEDVILIARAKPVLPGSSLDMGIITATLALR